MEEWYGRVFTVTDCFFAFLTHNSVFTYLHVCKDLYKKWLFPFFGWLNTSDKIKIIFYLFDESVMQLQLTDNFKANWEVSNWTYDMCILVNVFCLSDVLSVFLMEHRIPHWRASIKQILCFQLLTSFASMKIQVIDHCVYSVNSVLD